VRQVLDTGKLVVSGINMIKKHTKPNPQAGVSGGIVEREAPIQISNVAIYNSEAGRADRVGYKVEDGKKVRIYKSDGSAIDA
jgi:large subunit ribosomal protein L24